MGSKMRWSRQARTRGRVRKARRKRELRRSDPELIRLRELANEQAARNPRKNSK